MKIITSPGLPIEGNFDYLRGEYSLNFTPRSVLYTGSGITFGAGRLEIEADSETMQLLYPNGYFPYQGWTPRALDLPSIQDSSLYINSDGDLQGAFYSANDISVGTGEFVVYQDAAKGIFRIAQDGVPSSATVNRFCEGAALGLKNGNIIDLWLWGISVG